MSKDEGSSIAWFFSGAVIGAVAALLLAPRAGKETREKLADWLEESREKGEELLARVKEEALVKKEAVSAAAKAAKQAYSEHA